ncbi:sigma 54-interacting transcriptional regulator, partial [Pseudomonas aeruginosa]|nr:sigma 54-interacting transcriptional regulator [Pseudomonas aeruginosa]
RMRDLTRRAEDEHQRAEAYLEAAGERPREMIGQSAAHKALLEEIRLVANSDLSVLITGETGVGKELVAQSIHRHSMRSGKPMISLNCAALPETLVESELFGHVRGAFSGAVNERRGKFELADGGSLFLDEVGELPLAVQAKLLRVLQSGQLQRVGSDR